MQNKTVEQEFQYCSTQQALTDKDWAGGSRLPETTKEIVIGCDPPLTEITYSPAWYKIVDETIVNALDHFIRCIVKNSERVGEIALTVAPDLSEISVYNTGQGIPVAQHADASAALKRTIYVPEMAFGMTFQGSNVKKQEVVTDILESLIGGTNGIGVKLVNSFSTKFIVETCDTQRGLHYRQEWNGVLDDPSPPVITQVAKMPAKSRAAHTRVTFRPNYPKFETVMTKDLAAQYTAFIRHRFILATLYAYFAARQQSIQAPIMRFNGLLMSRYHRTSDVAKELFPSGKIHTGMMIPKPSANSRTVFTLPWEISIVTGIEAIDIHEISIINGVVVRSGGHINRARECIVEAVQLKLAKQLGQMTTQRIANQIKNHTFLILCCQIPNPKWGGQRKDGLEFPSTRFKHYELEAKTATAVANALADIIQEELEGKLSKVNASKDARIAIDPDIYTPAELAGTSHWRDTALILCEGASSVSTVKQGKVSRRYYGTISLGGVIMNVRRETKIHDNGATDRQLTVRSKRLVANKVFNNIITAVNLDINNKYEKPAVFHYGRIIACVDQDPDGAGNILGLILSMFVKIWPALISNNFIMWFKTPVIRAYPKGKEGKIKSFYSQYQYDEWAKKAPAHKVRYYKGLGTHNKEETENMFADFESHLYAFVLDDKAAENCEIYYGDDPAKRKIELARPTRRLTVAEQRRIDRTMQIECSTHLQTDTNEYQKDNLSRKLCHEIDGQNQAGRKILDALIQHMTATTRLRVSQFAGTVSKFEDYHHGEASLEKSIFSRGAIYVGGVQLPFLLPDGNFGTRLAGGDDHAQARYPHMCANKRLLDLLFPPEDYYLLEFKMVEDKRYEPQYFLPIIPLAVCESYEIPAHGWKLSVWARDVLQLIKVIQTMVRNGNPFMPFKLLPYDYTNMRAPYRGYIKNIGGEEYSYGCYKWVPKHNQIIITELPLRTWTQPYFANIMARIDGETLLNAYNDDTDPETVKIILTLGPGKYEAIQEAYRTQYHDGIIEWLHLRTKMSTHLNMMNINGGVTMYETYEEVVLSWYIQRSRMYTVRAERRIIMLELLIGYYQNIVRYIETSNKNKLATRKVKEMIEYLEAEGYVKYREKKLHNPGFVPNEGLRELCAGRKASYDYLIGLSDRKKSEESLAEYKALLAAVQNNLAIQQTANQRGHFPGSEIWLDELEKLSGVYVEGIMTNWTFGENDKYVFS